MYTLFQKTVGMFVRIVSTIIQKHQDIHLHYTKTQDTVNQKSDHWSVSNLPWLFPSGRQPKRPPSLQLLVHTTGLWCCPVGQTRPLLGYWGTQTPQTWGKEENGVSMRGKKSQCDRNFKQTTMIFIDADFDFDQFDYQKHFSVSLRLREDWTNTVLIFQDYINLNVNTVWCKYKIKTNTCWYSRHWIHWHWPENDAVAISRNLAAEENIKTSFLPMSHWVQIKAELRMHLKAKNLLLTQIFLPRDKLLKVQNVLKALALLSFRFPN